MAKKSGKGLVIVISGPSGSGKTTIARHLIERVSDIAFSVSHTTRALRGQEEDGHDYHYIEDKTFDAMVKNNDFLEWAHVHGKRYGTSKKHLQKYIEQGIDVILDIDVQGGRQIQQQIKESVLIFVVAPDLQTLGARLRSRRSDKEDEIERRLQVACSEIQDAIFYPYWIINHDLEQSVDCLRSILMTERMRALNKSGLASEILQT